MNGKEQLVNFTTRILDVRNYKGQFKYREKKHLPIEFTYFSRKHMTTTCYRCGKILQFPYKQDPDSEAKHICADCKGTTSPHIYTPGEADIYLNNYSNEDENTSRRGSWVGKLNKYSGKCLRCGCHVLPKNGQLFKCGPKWLVICSNCAHIADNYDWPIESLVNYDEDESHSSETDEFEN